MNSKRVPFEMTFVQFLRPTCEEKKKNFDKSNCRSKRQLHDYLK